MTTSTPGWLGAVAIAIGSGSIVGLFGWLCACHLNFRTYLAGIAVAAIGLVAWAFWSEAAHRTASYLVLYVLCFAPVAALFGLSPGVLLRRRARGGTILAVAIASALLAMPFWGVYVLYLGCVITGDCL